MTDSGRSFAYEKYPGYSEISALFNNSVVRNAVTLANEIYGDNPPGTYWELIEFQRLYRMRFGIGISQIPDAAQMFCFE